jgi:hypothetical protein
VIESRHAREEERVRVSGLLLFTAALTALLLATWMLLAAAMVRFARQEASLRGLAPPRFKDEIDPFPEPRLQGNPAAELARLKRGEAARLTSYGWVDRKAGIAHIPVERAIEIVATEGVPKWPTSDGQPTRSPERERESNAPPKQSSIPSAERTP